MPFPALPVPVRGLREGRPGCVCVSGREGVSGGTSELQATASGRSRLSPMGDAPGRRPAGPAGRGDSPQWGHGVLGGQGGRASSFSPPSPARSSVTNEQEMETGDWVGFGSVSSDLDGAGSLLLEILATAADKWPDRKQKQTIDSLRRYR